MNPTIDEFFFMWQDLENSKQVRAYFKKRDLHDLRIKNVTIGFNPTGDNVEARMEVNYDDPKGKQPNEDIIIVMKLNGDKWRVNSVTEIKL